MFNYELIIKNKNGEVKRYLLERGESKKGTYATLSGVVGNEVLPFGKLYVDESKIKTAKKAEGKPATSEAAPKS